MKLNKLLLFSVYLLGFQWTTLLFGHSLPGYSFQGSGKPTCASAFGGESDNHERVVVTLNGTSWPPEVEANFEVSTYNMENMLTPSDAMKAKNGSDLIKNGYKDFAKPLEELIGLANNIRTINPSFMILNEVSNLEILNKFITEFLNYEYVGLLIEGNDQRGIDVAAIVRKDLPLTVEQVSYRNLIDFKTQKKVFTRDLPLFLLREKGHENPFFIVIGTHGKASVGKKDNRSREKRRVQAQATQAIVNYYENLYPETPIVIAGDFNGNIEQSPEFEILRNEDLDSALDHAQPPIPANKRGTHISNNGHRSMLDGMIINAAALRIFNNAIIEPNYDKNGNPLPVTYTPEDREKSPSDHMPMTVSFNLLKNKNP